ncbi:TPA: hypothetical protein ACOTFP_001972 [Clostridium perfringens]|nr:hypothetical protein [Clostridium perfringens]
MDVIKFVTDTVQLAKGNLEIARLQLGSYFDSKMINGSLVFRLL